jgi:type IV pilus modification protein PilV
VSCGAHLRHCRQRGAGLVEVAIALLVLAIGALGLGSLQIAAKRMGFEAIQRTEAAALASDLLARLRANPLALPAYASTGIGEASGAQLPPPGADCDRGGCAPAAWAAWDLWHGSRRWTASRPVAEPAGWSADWLRGQRAAGGGGGLAGLPAAFGPPGEAAVGEQRSPADADASGCG